MSRQSRTGQAAGLFTLFLLLCICFRVNGLNKLTDCKDNSAANPKCSTGEVCDASTDKCICNVGYYAADGLNPVAIPSDTCSPCPPGKYKDQVGDGYAVGSYASCNYVQCCRDCPAGKFMTTNAEGTYSSGSVVVSQCLDCNAQPFGNFASSNVMYTSLPGAVSYPPCIGAKCWDDVCFHSPTGQPTRQPTRQPTGQPTRQPTGQPTRQPTRQPTGQPTRQPTGQPTRRPSGQPSSQPSGEPTGQPSSLPTQPTGQPSSLPTGQPTAQPSSQPTTPTGQPSRQPSGQPSVQPTTQPSGQPSTRPTVIPTRHPSSQPTNQPTGQPTRQPVSTPTSYPTSQPSSSPSQWPTGQPTSSPTGTPTSYPTAIPDADAGGIKVTLCFAGFWLFFLISALFREYQQSKRLLTEKKSLQKKSSSVSPDPNTGGGKNGRTVLSRGGPDSPSIADVEAPGDRDPRDVVKELLRVSLARIFEGVFSKEKNRIKKLEFEIEHNHSYFLLIWSRKVGVKRWIGALKLLTSLSLAALAICLVYDYHFPSNDGSCKMLMDAASCDEPRLRFDISKRQCRWQLERVTGFASFIPAMCTFNTNDDVYELSFFLHVIICVLLGMGAVNLVLDLIFEHIISAPATSKSTNVATHIALDSVRLKYHKKVQAQLLRLNKGIIAHREHLLSSGRIDELDEFDAQWGVNLTSDGSEEIIWMDKISADLYDVIRESQELRVKLESQSEIQCGTELLYLFALDVMGRNTPAARIFANKTEQAVKGTHGKVNIYVKMLFVLAIIVGDGLVLMYMRDATRHKLGNWMTWVGYGFLLYVALDVVSIEGSKIAWVHFMVPNAVAANASMAQSIIEQTLDKMCAENIDEHPDYAADASRDSQFSAAEHLFVSTRVAKHFPGLFESAVVLSYREPLPNASGFYWGQDTLHSLRSSLGTYNKSVKPTMGSGRDASLPPPQLGKSHPRELRDSLQKKAIQDVMMAGDEAESLGQRIYRMFMWFVLEWFSHMPIELQKFTVHILQPIALYGLMKLCYVILDYITVGFYIIVIVSVILAIIFVLHMSHESSEIEALEEEEAERAKSNLASGDYSGVSLVDRIGSPSSPSGTLRKRSPSFDSDDGDVHGQTSLIEALKYDKMTKKSYVNQTQAAVIAASPKVMNLRDVVQNHEKNAVFSSPRLRGKSTFERHLDQHEIREVAQSRQLLESLQGTPVADNKYGSRFPALKPPIFSAQADSDVEVRNAENMDSKFDHESEEIRYSRSSVEMEKAILKRLGYGKQQVATSDSDKNATPKFNANQVNPTATVGSLEKKTGGLLNILKSHESENERKLNSLPSSSNSPSPTMKFKRAVVHHPADK